MIAWAHCSFPRTATWSAGDGRLEATLRDDGKDITVRLTVINAQGADHTFDLYIKRGRDVETPSHYYVQDLAGAGFTPKTLGRGAGSFLVNAAIQYLKEIDEPEYQTIRGELFNTEEAEPTGHGAVRRTFFESLGAQISNNKGVGQVQALKPKPAALPFTGSRPQIVPLSSWQQST